MGNNSIDDETEAILNRSFTRKKRTASSMPASGLMKQSSSSLTSHLALRRPFGQHFHVFIGHFHQLQNIVIIAAVLLDIRYGLERL